MVKKASNGRLIIEPYGAGVLFPVPESFDAVRDGVVQMAMVWSGIGPGKTRLLLSPAAVQGIPSSISAKISTARKSWLPFW